MGKTLRRVVAVLSGSLLLGALLVAVTAGPSGAVTFTNSTPITIPSGAPGTTSGPASPYPSPISVSGLSGTIADVNVSLVGISHGYPNDVDVLLLGPGGQDVVLMADRCGTSALPLTFLTFDDDVSGSLPSAGCTSGSFKPTNGFAFSGPFPPGPYGSTLSVFDGTSPNGTWSLYVFDDFVLDFGSIASGWSLDITLATPTITSFTPTSGLPGTSVSVAGTNFTGATSVTFGGVGAVFTVNSPTKITATVPAGAVTGPIAVTTPNGTATSGSNFTVLTPAPTVVSFSPGNGKVGTAVIITGTNLTGATSVRFNGVPAAFVVNSPTQISASVPTGASTGPIAVTTAGGTGTSLTNFVVKHARDVSLHLSKAKGNVAVLDGFSACASGVPVKLQQKGKGGGFKTVKSGLTKPNGSFNLGKVVDGAKYRVLAPKTTLVSGDKCLKDKSPVVTA